MAVADLRFGTVILPRSDSPKAISQLAKFEWFHKIDSQNDTVTPEIDDVLLNAQKTFQAIDEVVKGLGIPLTTGIMEILFKGTVIKKDQYQLDDLKSMVADLEKKYLSVIEQPIKLLKESEDIKRSLAEYQTIKETLSLVKKLDVDIGSLGLMSHFYTNLFIIKTSDFEEIRRTLQDVTLYKYCLLYTSDAADE